jgi:hypothetical protein
MRTDLAIQVELSGSSGLKPLYEALFGCSRQGSVRSKIFAFIKVGDRGMEELQVPQVSFAP